MKIKTTIPTDTVKFISMENSFFRKRKKKDAMKVLIISFFNFNHEVLFAKVNILVQSNESIKSI